MLPDEPQELAVAPTAGEWGTSGTMVVTPPPAEAVRRIQGGLMPFTARQICVCASGHYVPEPEALANARLHAASKLLYEALFKLLKDVEPMVTSGAHLAHIAPAVVGAVAALQAASDYPVPATAIARGTVRFPADPHRGEQP